MTPRSFLLVVLTAAVGVSAFAVGRAGVGDDANTETDHNVDLLANAWRRTVAHDYSGVIDVQWHDARGTGHQAQTRVRYEHGLIEIGTSGHVVTADPSVPPPASAPRADDKYDVTRTAGPEVADHATTVFTARRDRDHALVERFYVDATTGLVLRRESFDGDGRSRRWMSFIHVWDDADRAGLAPMKEKSSPTSDARAITGVDAPYRAPGHAGDGFRLVARWKHSRSVVQLSYSDGLLSASVFEQPGRLNWDALPAGGQPANVDGHPAVAYSLPVGDTLVWEHAGIVYTCVGDAPREELLGIALDVSRRAHDGAVTRLARVALAPFAW